MKSLLILLCVGLATILTGCAKGDERAITAFVGSASKPPIEEIASEFTKSTGIKAYLNFGGSGTMLVQMELAKTGDLYIPGSPDYMVMAERDGVVEPGSAKIVAYLIPVIAVQKGNPRNLQSLADLARPGIKVGIANPESVCLGLYTIEVLDNSRLLPDVWKNIATQAESCEKTATLLALKSVDAIIGWDVFAHWNTDSIDIVYLKPEQVPRIGYIPAAVDVFTKDRERARKFVDFLVSPPAQQIFRRWGYITTESEARRFAPNARIGGEYQLPDTYKKLVTK